MFVLFRNQQTYEEYGLALPPHDCPEGHVELGPLGYLSISVVGWVYYTHTPSYEVDKDIMTLILSELTKLPVDQINLTPFKSLP